MATQPMARKCGSAQLPQPQQPPRQPVDHSGCPSAAFFWPWQPVGTVLSQASSLSPGSPGRCWVVCKPSSSRTEASWSLGPCVESLPVLSMYSPQSSRRMYLVHVTLWLLRSPWVLPGDSPTGSPRPGTCAILFQDLGSQSQQQVTEMAETNWAVPGSGGKYSQAWFISF